MAGEIVLINPRRHRRKKNARKRRHHRRHANPFMHRKRHVSRRRRHNPRRHRRHVRHNPGRILGGNLMKGVTFAAGAIATDIAGGIAQKWIPPSWNLDPAMSRIGAKALVGIGAPMLAKQFRLPSSITTPWLIGGVVVTVLDIFNTYIAPKMGLTLQEYEQVSSYEMLPGATAMAGTEGDIYGDGAF
jgi:hypothetical protein